MTSRSRSSSNPSIAGLARRAIAGLCVAALLLPAAPLGAQESPPEPPPERGTKPAATTAWEQTIGPLAAGFESSWVGGWVRIRTQNTVHCAYDANNVLYTRTRTPPNTNDVDWARWRPNLPAAAWYNVYVHIPQYSSSMGKTTRARYRVNHANGSTLVVVDQRNRQCQWAHLGEFRFNAGTGGNVYMGDYTGDNPAQLIAADAARFVIANRPPNVPNLVAPANGAMVASNVTLQVQDTGDPDNWPRNYRDYCYRLERLNDGWAAENCWTAGTTWAVSLGPGNYRWRAQSGDGEAASGWTGWWTFNIDVPPPPPDTTPPDGYIVSPAANASIGPGTVSFTAEAWDNAGGSGVDRVEFYVAYDGAWRLVAADTTAPYATTWNTPAGLTSQTLNFTIHVIDNAGNRAMDPGGYRYVTFTAPPLNMSIVEAARSLSGMPYSATRRPYCGNKGPWRSVNGVCTDLVIDAYLAGTGGTGAGGTCRSNDWTWTAMGLSIGGVNLEAALRADAQAHPGRYRHRSARNSGDMRTYFAHNQIYLSKHEAWQPGDVVFLDWPNGGRRDGWADHVGIITAVDGNSRPTRMMHAPGSSARCAHGHACEVTWNSYYWDSTLGHGRLRAGMQTQEASTSATEWQAGEMIAATAVYTGHWIEATVDQPATTLQMTLRDADGRYVTDAMNDNLLAGNDETFIPYVAYATHEALSDTQVIRYYGPPEGNYRIDLTGGAATDYSARLRLYNGATIRSEFTYYRHAQAGETQAIVVMAVTVNGETAIYPTAPAPTDHMSAPETLTASVAAGQPFALAWVVSETTGPFALGAITATLSGFTSRMGDDLMITVLESIEATLSAGASAAQELTAVFPATTLSGVYYGTLTIHSASGKTHRVAVELDVQGSDMANAVYLPAVIRSWQE